ncbi:MAG: hypothetical protein O7D96_05985, partial [SAR324 cluster bacterium]|nr:hypothetical protein [SAR324 cluster bacterium]
MPADAREWSGGGAAPHPTAHKALARARRFCACSVGIGEARVNAGFPVHLEQTMGKALSEAEIERYRQEGYHFPVRAFSADEMAGLRREAEALEGHLGESLVDYRSKIHLVSTVLSGLIRHPAILDAVE